MRFMAGILAGVLLFCATPALAEEQTPPQANWEVGPKTVNVGGDLAHLKLKDNHVFAHADDTRKLMAWMGNTITNTEVGLVAPQSEEENWFVVLEYNPMGYIKDDESKDLNADEILKHIQEGTEAHNQELAKEGVPALHVIGWQDPPHYDKQTHNLVWSILAESGNKKLINTNVRLLGRHGVTSATLVGPPEQMNVIQPELDYIVSNYEYQQGKRYADFIPGKDKVAEIGLTALVAGGVGAAAAKTGLFAKFILPILLGLKKLWILALVAIGALFTKLKSFFGGQKDDNA